MRRKEKCCQKATHLWINKQQKKDPFPVTETRKNRCQQCVT